MLMWRGLIVLLVAALLGCSADKPTGQAKATTDGDSSRVSMSEACGSLDLNANSQQTDLGTVTNLVLKGQNGSTYTPQDFDGARDALGRLNQIAARSPKSLEAQLRVISQSTENLIDAAYKQQTWNEGGDFKAALSEIGVLCGLGSIPPAQQVSTCDAVREALLTGTPEQIETAMEALKADKAAPQVAREYADYYLNRDANNPSQREMDKGLIRTYCGS